MEFIKGHRADYPRMKNEGFKKLSKEFWSDGDVKVRVLKDRYATITPLPRFKQRIDDFRSKGGGGGSNHANQVLKCCR